RRAAAGGRRGGCTGRQSVAARAGRRDPPAARAAVRAYPARRAERHQRDVPECVVRRAGRLADRDPSGARRRRRDGFRERHARARPRQRPTALTQALSAERMRGKGLWLALGIGAYAAFLLARFPAGASSWFAPDTVRLAGVDGTLWSGRAAF